MTALREADIRPDELMAEQARRFEADVAWLVSQRHRFVEVDCPACDAPHREPAWRKYDVEWVRCTACETAYLSPRPDPGLMAEYYRTSRNYEYWNEVIFPRSEERRRASIFRPRAERVAAIARRHGVAGGTIADVGAGYGTFCEEMRDVGAFDRVIALEPEPHLAQTCRDKGLETIEARVEDAELGALDAVTSFEVVEHLFSPRAFVRRCRQLLPTGGLFVVTCPNVRGFDFELLGPASVAVDPEHVNLMHPDSLGALLDSEGFEVLERQTPGRLDAELVRKAALDGTVDLSGQPLLQRVLLDEWDRLGDAFQDFLAAGGLSSHMWLVARRR
jgi:2-polyprenyl-3-methyl-5-hydroxy-6-metoxy-1,4-benzoquinol methylase/Zn ribbon nucleic-acid-binding protein